MSDIFENKGAMTATIVVAASDSLNKAAANYVCSGAADDVEINQALTAGAGGEIVLLEGNYVTVANITVPADTKLSGMGKGTIITANHADITQAIELSDRSTLADLKVILAAGCGTAGARPNVVYATSKTLVWVENVWTVGDETVDDANDTRQNGIYFDTVTNSKIINCRIEDNKRHGIQLCDASNYNTIEGNTCEGNNQSGIYLSASGYNVLTGNISEGNATNGIYLNASSNNTITGNLCEGNTANGIYLYSSCDNNTVTGNTCQGNSGSGIYLDDCDNNTITGNTCQGNAEGITIYNGSVNNTITGNTCADSTTDSGIDIAISNENVVTGNQCDSNALHGIYIYRSSYCSVTGNGCHNQDSGDGINVTGDATTNSDYNTLTGNACTGNADDGIEIAGGGDANKNIVVGNQLLGNTGTALVDGGVATDVGHNITA